MQAAQVVVVVGEDARSARLHSRVQHLDRLAIVSALELDVGAAELGGDAERAGQAHRFQLLLQRLDLARHDEAARFQDHETSGLALVSPYE